MLSNLGEILLADAALKAAPLPPLILLLTQFLSVEYERRILFYPHCTCWTHSDNTRIPSNQGSISYRRRGRHQNKCVWGILHLGVSAFWEINFGKCNHLLLVQKVVMQRSICGLFARQAPTWKGGRPDPPDWTYQSVRLIATPDLSAHIRVCARHQVTNTGNYRMPQSTGADENAIPF